MLLLVDQCGLIKLRQIISLVSSCVCARMTAACVSISTMMKTVLVSISFNIIFRTGYRTVIKDAVHALYI